MDNRTPRFIQGIMGLLVLVALLLFGSTSLCKQIRSQAALAAPDSSLTNLNPHMTTRPLSCGWQVMSTLNPSATQNKFGGVAAVSSNNVWAVGYQTVNNAGRTLIEHWDGTRWNLVPSPNVGAPVLASVTAISENDIWAVGNSYIPTDSEIAFVLHWDGSQWSVVPSPSPGAGTSLLIGVSAASANDVWAVGNYVVNVGGVGYSRTLAEHWDGNQWSVIPSPNVGTDNNTLQDVSVISSNDVWAVGDYFDHLNPAEHPLTLHWDGSQWSIVPSPNPTGSWQTILNGVAATSTNDVWAAGVYGNIKSGGLDTLILHWDGSQWTQTPSPNGGMDTDNLWGVSALSAHDAWAVGKYIGSTRDETLTLHWDGLLWSLVPSPSPGNIFNGLYGVAQVTENDAWAVGQYWNGNGRPFQTLAEHYVGPCPSPSATPSPATPTSTRPPTGTATPSITPTITSTLTPTGSATPTRTATPTGTPCIITFTDVYPTDYFYEPVRYLYCLGAISGYGDNSFRPQNNTTRGQLCKIVVLAEGWPIYTPPMPTFRDVPSDYPFYQYIETAYNHSIISGYDDGTFRPGNEVTRGQLCKVVVRAEGWPIYTPPTPTFRDVSTSNTFYEYIETAYFRGIITGYEDGTFRPGNPATRGQISKIVYRAITAPFSP